MAFVKAAQRRVIAKILPLQNLLLLVGDIQIHVGFKDVLVILHLGITYNPASLYIPSILHYSCWRQQGLLKYWIFLNSASWSVATCLLNVAFFNINFTNLIKFVCFAVISALVDVRCVCDCFELEAIFKAVL